MRVARLPFLLGAGFSLVSAILAGLFRIGWPLPLLQADLPLAHGPLMVSGFLGTLIGLEKAVAHGRLWAYAGVAATALGGAGLAVATEAAGPRLLLFAGSLGLVAVSAVFAAKHRSSANAFVLCGASSWAAGNFLFLRGWPIFAAVPAWIGFLLLVIVGERLELNRLLRPSRASRAFVHSAAALAVGAIALAAAGFPLGGSVSGTGGASRFTGTVFDLAIRLLGIACSGLGVWLLSNDMARASWKLPGLSRFMAASLLAGYLWLTLSGSLLALQGSFVAGEAYDAALHAFFLGFVFSMIFAHGPVIFPAILSIPIAFHPVFYAHLALLHLGVALRVAGDLTPLAFLRPWGGLLNAAAILLFLISTAARAAAGARARTAT